MTDANPRDLIRRLTDALNDLSQHLEAESPAQAVQNAHKAWKEARAYLAQPEPEQLPQGYVDPEHKDQERELLEVFYRACRSEGGTADEIHLRGIKAVLANAPLAQPEPEGPTDEEIDQLSHETWKLRKSTQWAIRTALARWGK